jgi:hypothetical protein
MQTISEARLALDSSSSSESNPIPREKKGKKKRKKYPEGEAVKNRVRQKSQPARTRTAP